MHNAFTHPITVAFFTLLAILFVVSLQKTKQKTFDTYEVLEQKQQEVDQLAKEVVILEEKMNETDQPIVREKIIRDELLLQKPGEIIVQLPPLSADDGEMVTPTPTPVPLEAWKDVLF